MPQRTKEWNEGLAKDLRNRRFAQEFIIAGVEEGVPLPRILAKVIRAYGVQEFARRVHMAPSNVSRAISPRSNPTQATLARLLRPFGLRLSVVPIKDRLAA